MHTEVDMYVEYLHALGGGGAGLYSLVKSVQVKWFAH